MTNLILDNFSFFCHWRQNCIHFCQIFLITFFGVKSTKNIFWFRKKPTWGLINWKISAHFSDPMFGDHLIKRKNPFSEWKSKQFFRKMKNNFFSQPFLLCIPQACPNLDICIIWPPIWAQMRHWPSQILLLRLVALGKHVILLNFRCSRSYF